MIDKHKFCFFHALIFECVLDLFILLIKYAKQLNSLQNTASIPSYMWWFCIFFAVQNRPLTFKHNKIILYVLYIIFILILTVTIDICIPIHEPIT